MPTARTAANGTAKNVAAKTNGKANESMPNSKFHQLFMEELKDIYWAEKNLVKALPKMQKAATSSALITAIANHLEETKGHVTRLEDIFEMMGKKPQAKKCEAMEGLIAEGQEVVDDTDEDTAVRDAGIIIASQKIEHYEISAYGSLRTLANVMGHKNAAKLLGETLQEEKDADSLLTEVAETTVNAEAASE
ncbi:ferritin-like domain-containing protein [Chitinophaga sp. MM2321]|uniref:YciE/YciF ferroxidase family protein n=1 Tax=Chitinophaga sp. MM2321 TaxID=3137178 RepID=UPI0032D56EB9